MEPRHGTIDETIDYETIDHGTIEPGKRDGPRRPGQEGRVAAKPAFSKSI
jgi:hypothetical protein